MILAGMVLGATVFREQVAQAALAVLSVKVWSIARLLVATRGASGRAELAPSGDHTLVP
jgi:hypothetical protein